MHPSRESIAGVPCFGSTAELPNAPDAAFIGVNREATIAVTKELADKGAAGAICFASGFKESSSCNGQDLQERLLEVAGEMRVLGPNCYGYLNYLDNICMWPDEHGGVSVTSGVAIIAQSSNIAINMTMQRVGLPISHMITLGNQAQVGVSEVVLQLLEDPRVNAIGLYLESFGDIRAFESMAHAARDIGKSLVVLKVGKTEKGQQASLTHTASLVGDCAVSSAFLDRLGIVEVDSISVLLETLKIVNAFGPLAGNRLVSVSCSGGEASLMADIAEGMNIDYPDFDSAIEKKLANILGTQVDVANPLDYHTYIWGDVATMANCFSSVMHGGFDLCVFVLDVPRSDRCDPSGHQCAIDALIEAKQKTAANVAVISVLPENLEAGVIDQFADAGIITLHGMQTGLLAIDRAIQSGMLAMRTICLESTLLKTPSTLKQSQLIDEHTAKQELHSIGLMVPKGRIFSSAEELDLMGMNPPFVVKALGVAHKSEAGAVHLNIHHELEISNAISQMADLSDSFLVEEMIHDVVAELLLGITVDETGLVALTLGAGGVLTELLDDTITLLLPTNEQEVLARLKELKVSKLLQGYRGKDKACLDSVISSILAVQRYVTENLQSLVELDVNPLMVTKQAAVAADALLVKQS